MDETEIFFTEKCTISTGWIDKNLPGPVSMHYCNLDSQMTKCYEESERDGKRICGMSVLVFDGDATGHSGKMDVRIMLTRIDKRHQGSVVCDNHRSWDISLSHEEKLAITSLKSPDASKGYSGWMED